MKAFTKHQREIAGLILCVLIQLSVDYPLFLICRDLALLCLVLSISISAIFYSNGVSVLSDKLWYGAGYLFYMYLVTVLAHIARRSE